MRRVALSLFLLLGLLLGATAAHGQDVLTLGTGSGPAGGVVSIPVSVLDRSGTSLGSDAGAGHRIQGIALKVMFPTELVESVSFARAGVTASLTPLFETSLQGSGWFAYVVSFSEGSNAIPLTPNAAPPGDTIGMLTVTLQAQAGAGSTATLRIDPPGAILSSQSSTTRETVALGNLSLVNGGVTVTAGIPAGLTATAVTATQVSVTWNAAAGADHYEVWRSVDGGAFTFAASRSTTDDSDLSVTAGKTYLYRVRAVDATGGTSAFSDTDAATTILFGDDPLVAQTTNVKLIHVTQLREAVNAFRASANLAPLPADGTISAGAAVRASHLATLRTALNEARTAIGLSALSFTDATLTPGSTPIRASHVQELRDGVK